MSKPRNSFLNLVLPVVILLLLACKPATVKEPPKETQDAARFTLVVLHTNDTHSRFLQFNKHGNTCNDEEAAASECFGGVARRVTEINRIRSQEQNVILVDAGDQFQGTLFYTLYRSAPAIKFMNMLGYDAMTLGNHEFDDGPEELAKLVQGLKFPVVSANIDFSLEPLLKGSIQPYVIKEIDGNKVGILGVTTEDVPEISEPGPNVMVGLIQPAIEKTVTELENQGVKIIILLSHSGLARDLELATSVAGVDIIVGGHTHSLLSNTDPAAEGTYPIMMTSPADEPVLVVTAQAWGKYLGDLKVIFDSEGVVDEWSGDPILLDNSVPEDTAVLQEVINMSTQLVQLRAQKVGRSTVDLGALNEGCRYAECNLGDLITDAMLWETKDQGMQIAFYNGGGIRTSLPEGEISMEQVLEVLPFFDTVATMGLKGADVREALEYSVSRAESTQNEGTGRFLQVSGLRFNWNPDAGVGSRVTRVEVRNPDGTYTALDDNMVYKVAVTDYLRGGGDGYTIFAERAIDPYDFGRAVSDILVEYLETNSPVSPGLEGRISKGK
jgi:5'-nucleotidase